MQKLLTFIVFLSISFSRTEIASATQAHGGEEGLYSHQLAHVIFLVAMIYLCVRLVRSGDSARRGWRWITVSAFLFCLWNLDALFVHTYRELLHPDLFSGTLPGGLPRTFHAASFPDLLYYLGRFDHLFALPALLFFFMGLRSLLKEQEASR